MSHRNYVTLGEDRQGGAAWQIHYREAGAGTPVVLLHPSPLSSGFMEPLITLFAKRARAIAWDTPGYGQSDPLPGSGEGLRPYVEALHAFISALGVEKPVIYGSATGAQIAIEYAKVYPDEVRALVLENVALFSDAERARFMDAYFPDLKPQTDGRHLSKVWEMVSQLYHYFPWYDTSKEALVNEADVPVEILQRTALDYLIAGPDYTKAYQAAFLNERLERLQPLTVPAQIVRWQGSLLKKYSDRLDEVELPSNIKMHFAGAGVEARFEVLDRVLSELI